MRLIDADRTITVTYYDEEHEEWSQKTRSIWDTILEVGDEIPPTIDPVKHGRWMRPWPTRAKSYMRICSECGESCWYCGGGDYRYCPNCGAKMEEK